MALTGGAGKLLKFTKAPVKAIPKAKVVPKVNNVAAKGGFDAVGAFKNAISPFKGGNLTNAGRAVTKHPGYFGFESTEALMGAYRTPGALNNLGSTTLKDILRNGVRTTGAGGRYPNGWTTYTLPNGNAASWGLDGTFIGFRGIK
jgi:filamentous hemagglutinin